MTDQRTLFDTEPPAWEADDAATDTVATVVFPGGPHGEFDYRVGDDLRDALKAVSRVRVPLGRGNRAAVGYCVRVETRTVGPRKLKQVLDLIDVEPVLSQNMLRLTQWISEYYLCSWGQVLETVLPTGVREQAGVRTQLLLALSEQAQAQVAAVKLPPKQAKVVEVLAKSGPMTFFALTEAAGCTNAPITSLRQKGIVVTQTRRIRALPREAPPEKPESNLQLNADQQKALDAILRILDSRQHGTVLLHGVTGSGKTEVYIQAIEQVRRMGRQAIVLVPEISLTPQTKQRFRARFGQVAVLHSHLSDAERSAYWDQIARGEVSVVVGARSAIFAPTPHLGLIVLDEEHESSFKQNTSPRYHARDVALFRAQAENVPLVLGSATPSLESWQRAQAGQFQMIPLPRRVFDRPMPHVSTIDLRVEFMEHRYRGAISRPLQRAMEKTLSDEGQVILLLNRRGYSTHIQCPSCGSVVCCPSCELALTHHRTGEMALCHYCDYEIPLPTACPKCNFSGIRFSGLGTQKLEAEVQARFPNHACLRMDTDSMQKRGSHEEALAAFRDGQVRILLGTQMIAKGLDFPDVTLVGVINADTALHLPDFRAAERTCQLIVQVAGRTGRGERGGSVIVQSFSPEHPAIQAAVTHDYQDFALQELIVRAGHAYPPYAQMIRLIVRGSQPDQASVFARHLGDRLKDKASEETETVRVLGPAPCPLPKLRGQYSYHLQVQGAPGEGVRRVVRTATADLSPANNVQWTADVDPIDML